MPQGTSGIGKAKCAHPILGGLHGEPRFTRIESRNGLQKRAIEEFLVEAAGLARMVLPLAAKFLEWIRAQTHRSGNNPHLMLIGRHRVCAPEVAQLQAMLKVAQERVCLGET
jgi:hypothetical protein